MNLSAYSIIMSSSTLEIFLQDEKSGWYDQPLSNPSETAF